MVGGRQPGRRKRDRIAQENEDMSPAIGYSLGGFSTKIYLVADGNGLPMTALLTAGQRRESACFSGMMDRVRVPRPARRPKSSLRRSPETGLTIQKKIEDSVERKHRVGDSSPKQNAYWTRTSPDVR
jgi:hypothetical protein